MARVHDLNLKDIQELLNWLTPKGPCANGHIFQWTTYISTNETPSKELRCMCNKYSYEEVYNGKGE